MDIGNIRKIKSKDDNNRSPNKRHTKKYNKK